MIVAIVVSALAMTVIVALRYLAASGGFALATRVAHPGLYRGLDAQIRREIGWSLASAAIYGIPAGVLAWGWRAHGWTRVYTDLHAFPLWYWPLAVFLYLALHDAWFYWTHRWMHRPRPFRLAHAVHHASRPPTAWAAMAFHPLEALTGAVVIPALVLAVPIHVGALALVLTIMTVMGITNHMGWEIFPRWLWAGRLGGWLITASHHQRHHDRYRCNYGLYFRWWDRWCGTDADSAALRPVMPICHSAGLFAVQHDRQRSQSGRIAFRRRTNRSFAVTRIALLAGAAALFAALPAAAQSAPEVTPTANAGAPLDLNKDTITVGAGAAYVPDYEGSNNYRVVPAPIVVGTFKGYSFTVIGNRATINLIKGTPGPTWNIEAGPIGVVNFNRTSNSNIDDVRVARLPERSTAIELGGYVGLSKTGVITSPYDKVTLSASLRHDVTGKNDSYVFSPSLTYLTPLSLKAAVGLTASGSYVGTKYARYYYGVSDADSAASGLPVFNPSHDWSNYTVGGFATYSITGNLLHGFKVIAGGTYSREMGSAAQSPLVSIAGSRNQFIGAAGVAYTF